MAGWLGADQDNQSQQSQTGKLKQYISRMNEEADDAMSNIATAHVGVEMYKTFLKILSLKRGWKTLPGVLVVIRSTPPLEQDRNSLSYTC